MSAAGPLYLPARAKLNLVLRVVGRRDDGYHLLDTLFHTLDLHDDVTVARGPAGVRVSVTADDDSLSVPADERNLVVRGLRAFVDEVGCGTWHDGGFDVHLHKRIPNGAGLGGGSSDAAAALRLANRLHRSPLDDAALARLAVRLGADVPFFLSGGSQWGRGIGDRLSPATGIAPQSFVLIVPPYGCATAEVYKIHAERWQDGAPAGSVPPITVPENRDAAMGIGYCNELEEAAERLRPELGRLRRAVVALGFDRVHMSGSGSTLFVALPDDAAAQACREALEQGLRDTEHRGLRFVVTRSGPDRDEDQPVAVARTSPHGPGDPP